MISRRVTQCILPSLSLNFAVLKSGIISGALFALLVFGPSPGVGASDPSVSLQPVSQSRNLGQTATFQATANGTAPLTYDWRKDGASLGLPTSADLSLSTVKASDAGAYSVVVRNGMGNAVTSTAANLFVNQALLDPTFTGGVKATPLGIQGDGRILVDVIQGNLITGPLTNFLARLRIDGTREPGYEVRCVFGRDLHFGFGAATVQSNGSVVVGGAFTNLVGQTRKLLARVGPNGNVESAFSLGLTGSEGPDSPTPSVSALAESPDGKVPVTGVFTNSAGLNCNGFARLLKDGTPDACLSGIVAGVPDCLAFQTDGKLMVGGILCRLTSLPRTNLFRLNVDGTPDATFDAGIVGNGVKGVVIQPDGKMVIIGNFLFVRGQFRNGMARVHSDGSLDAGFDPQFLFSPETRLLTLALQTDGKILVGGTFSQVAGKSVTNLVRLHVNGAVDASFVPEIRGGDVRNLVIQADGRVLVSGSFSVLAGEPCDGFGRLLNPDPAFQSLTWNRSAITWLRGGSSPEIYRATFDHSWDGATWRSLGTGVRTQGGWQLTGLPPAGGGILRARGYVNGRGGRSSWFTETHAVVPPAIISENPDFGIHANGFRFSTLGWPGQPLTIESSTNFIDWTPLETNVAGLAPVGFIDTNWSKNPFRFYRARSR